MAKNPEKSNPSPRPSQRVRSESESAQPEGAAAWRARRPPAAASSELDDLESELSGPAALEPLANEGSDVRGEPRVTEGAPSLAIDGGRTPAPSRRGFGSMEWAALGGCALLALLAGVLFFKFLYGHRAPVQGQGLPSSFSLPMTGPSMRLNDAEAGWRLRVEGDKARAEEVRLPTIALTLDQGQSTTGFVRVEFVDPDDKIRGDILIVPVEAGRFKDSGRGEIIEEGGLRVRVVGTVGFYSDAMFTSYLAGQEPRWSVRIKEGPDSSNGPWTQLDAALIPNTKL